MNAFKENTVDYPLKPIGAGDVDRTVTKLRRWATAGRGNPSGPQVPAPASSELEASSQFATHLLVPIGDLIKPLDVNSIVYLESKDKYTDIRTESESYLVDRTLVDLERRLAPRQFLRIHRRHIINVRYIKEMQKWGNRRMRVVTTVPTASELFVSRRCVGEVMNRLEYCT